MDSPNVTPRRSQRIQTLPPSPSSTIKENGKTSFTSKMGGRKSPFFPTTLEVILLSVYPATLVLGSIFALLDPTARSAPYNAVTQSHFADTAPSYFATKGNIFNRFFVKQGWAWVTFSYFLFLFTHPSAGPSLQITPRRIKGTLRWGVVTIWWIFVTQWFFGPAIIDRGFVLTGGQCELVEAAEAGHVEMDGARQFFTGVACKTVGGKWKGGHDISGHVFLLVIGSMFLFEEVLHVVLKSPTTEEERTVYMGDGAIKSANIGAESGEYGIWTLGAKVVLGVAGLSLYMLLMTAAYFHTWFEKVSLDHVSYANWMLTFLVHWFDCSFQWHLCCVLLASSNARFEKHHRSTRYIDK
jgi:hypothetical protein